MRVKLREDGLRVGCSKWIESEEGKEKKSKSCSGKLPFWSGFVFCFYNSSVSPWKQCLALLIWRCIWTLLGTVTNVSMAFQPHCLTGELICNFLMPCCCCWVSSILQISQRQIISECSWDDWVSDMVSQAGNIIDFDPWLGSNSAGRTAVWPDKPQ